MTLKEAKMHWDERLSESEREEISSLYDDKSIKLDDIVKKYNLPFDKSKLPALVLPKQTDETCKWCGEKLFIKRRRTAMYANYSAFCIKCGHVNDSSCACDRCVDFRERQKEQERAAEEQRRQEKSRRIIEKYGKKTFPIDFNSLQLCTELSQSDVFERNACCRMDEVLTKSEKKIYLNGSYTINLIQTQGLQY